MTVEREQRVQRIGVAGEAMHNNVGQRLPVAGERRRDLPMAVSIVHEDRQLQCYRELKLRFEDALLNRAR